MQIIILPWKWEDSIRVSEFYKSVSNRKIPFTNVLFLLAKSFTTELLQVTNSLRERQIGSPCPKNRLLIYQQYSKTHRHPLLLHLVLCNSYSTPSLLSNLINTYFYKVMEILPQLTGVVLMLFKQCHHGAMRQPFRLSTLACSWFCKSF